MLGEALAILTAILWAISTVLSAEALKKIDPIRSNVIRTLFSAVLSIPVAMVAGDLNSFSNIDLNALILVMLAAIIGFGVGDTLLFKSITIIGVSRAYTIVYTSPFFTMILAVVLLNEPFIIKYLVGTVLIVLAVIVISIDNNNDADRGIISLEGIMLALLSSLCWAIGTILVAIGVKNISVYLANMVRYAILFLFLLLISKPMRRWNITKKDLVLLSASGATGMVIAGIMFLLSLKLIGASRATPLSSSSPVWASIMSAVFLKEKVTPRLLLSAIIVTVGTYFLI
ncbi:DMT family transporter [Candidatus Bathyarchaeota archaeon]|nr:DMT family transporter [Candidatus Bathyarchaeota archaeon]